MASGAFQLVNRPGCAAAIGRKPLPLPDGNRLHTVRTRMMARLAGPATAAGKLLTVVAPTGYGKTTLMRELFLQARHAGRSVFWITAADCDSGIEPLLTRLEAALGVPAFGRRSNALTSARLARLMEWIKAVDIPTTVFIDQFESCCNETGGQLLETLAFDSPQTWRWTVSSRRAIPIDRVEAQLRGCLHEVLVEDLQFEHGEVRQMLEPALGERLRDDDVDIVRRMTEGWPAAIGLLIERLRYADDPHAALSRFSGTDADLGALFEQRLLAALPQRLRALLLELSLLPYCCVESCLAVSSQRNPAGGFSELLACGAFMIRAADGMDGYRLHRLLAEYLRRQARLELGEPQCREVLARACQWFMQRSRWREAVESRIEAHDLIGASDILERSITPLIRDRGDLITCIEWVRKIRAQGCEIGPRAYCWYLWALAFRRGDDDALLQIEHLERRLRHEDAGTIPEDEVTSILQQIDVIRCCIDYHADRLGQARLGAEQYLARQKPGSAFDRATMATVKSACLLDQCEFDEARRAIQIARSAVVQTGSGYGTGWVGLFEGLINLRTGCFVEARRDLSLTMDECRRALGDDAPLIGTLALVKAKAAIELGFDDEARGLLSRGLAGTAHHGAVDLIACGFDAAVKLSMGAPDEQERMAHLQRIASEYPPRLSLMLSCFRIRALLRLSRIDEALGEAVPIGLNPVHKKPACVPREIRTSAACRIVHAITGIHLTLATSTVRLVIGRIEDETRKARSEGRTADLIELHLLAALAATLEGKPGTGRRALMQAIMLAAPRGIVRPIHERSEMISTLVSGTKMKEWQFQMDSQREFFARLCCRLPTATEDFKGSLEDLGIHSALSNPLTRREVGLLRLVQSGLSNAQLADNIGVSVSTVKWHLYNLYGKLGVRNRSSAIAKAKVLNLLPH